MDQNRNFLQLLKNIDQIAAGGLDSSLFAKDENGRTLLVKIIISFRFSKLIIYIKSFQNLRTGLV